MVKESGTAWPTGAAPAAIGVAVAAAATIVAASALFQLRNLVVTRMSPSVPERWSETSDSAGRSPRPIDQAPAGMRGVSKKPGNPLVSRGACPSFAIGGGVARASVGLRS